MHVRPQTIEGLSDETSPGPVMSGVSDSGDVKDPQSEREKRRADVLHGAADDPSTAARQPRKTHKKLHDLSDISSLSLTARGALDEYRFNM